MGTDRCSQIESQLNYCGKEFGQFRRFLPHNIANQRYFESVQSAHCLFYYEAWNACKESNRAKVDELTHAFVNSQHRAKFLPPNRSKPFFDWFKNETVPLEMKTTDRIEPY